MGRVGEVQWESVFGTTFPGYYAMFATRHMYEFGTTHEQMMVRPSKPFTAPRTLTPSKRDPVDKAMHRRVAAILRLRCC
jgi:hypothetical protein